MNKPSGLLVDLASTVAKIGFWPVTAALNLGCGCAGNGKTSSAGEREKAWAEVAAACGKRKPSAPAAAVSNAATASASSGSAQTVVAAPTWSWGTPRGDQSSGARVPASSAASIQANPQDGWGPMPTRAA